MKRVKHSTDHTFRVEITPFRTPQNEERFALKIVVHNSDPRTVVRGFELGGMTRSELEQAAAGDFSDRLFHPLTKRPAWAEVVQLVAAEALR